MPRPSPISDRGVPANLLELPLHFAVMSWGAIVMGMSGHDLRTFHMLRKHLSATSAANTFSIQSNGMESVDTAWVVIGAFTFVWGLVGTFLSVQQFKGRKGSYTGKGTSLWATSGIIYLVMTALWLGVTAAYTYYAVNQSYTLQGEADLQEPLSEPLRFLTYQIAQSFWTGYADALFVPTSLSQLGISTVTLGPWGTATSLSQVNDLAGKYKSIHFYRAELICCWFGLATVFTAFAVHVLMPITLRTLGWTRSEKKLREEAPLVPFEDKDYYPYPYHY